MSSWYQTVGRFQDPVGAARIATFLDILRRYPTGHLVDLGAGHGVFSRLAADLGWRVTAVDVRSVRFPEDSNVQWVVSDVREFDDYGDVDVVACLGLWYHLSLDDQTQLLQRIAPLPLILDTHVALSDEVQQHRSRTGDLVTRQGLVGRLYDESDLQQEPTASWGNLASFWPTLPSLQQQVYAAGYDSFEACEPAYMYDRGFFVASSLGDAAAVADIEQRIATVNPLTNPDAPAAGSLISLTSELTTKPIATSTPAPTPAPKAAAAAAAPVLPIRVALDQFARSAQASGKRKAGQARRAWRRRASS